MCGPSDMKVRYNLMGVVVSPVAPQKPISHHLHRYKPGFSIIDIPHNDDDHRHHSHQPEYSIDNPWNGAESEKPGSGKFLR